MAAPQLAEHTARLLLTIAARRWPAGLADVMRAEWAAELACLRDRPWRMLAFAGSLAVADPPGRARSAGAALVVVLLAAALVNGVRTALHSVETLLPWSGEATLVCALLAASVLAMALAGARWAPRHPVRAALFCGLFGYAFLLAGNESAVMPFMGWRDITPAVLTWTALITATAWAVPRLRTAGRHRTATATAVTGAVLAVQAAAITGSLHAAHTLGVPLSSAPAWLPLSLLPGGNGGFGPYLADGTATFHASDILLAGTATRTGPLLLCAAFLTAALLRSTRPQPARSPALLRRLDPRIAAGAGTAALVLVLAEWLPRSTTVAELALPRVIDNSTVFGFGFLAHPAGPALLALTVALLAVRRPAH